ncbi:MAG: hypothetical protein ICV62_09755 [Cyanobacteria bacterium Co-bin13]|nr:hypothetical protein [Cyanobacteria bacterium Co-bin13]
MVLGAVGADVIEGNNFPVQAFTTSPCRLPAGVNAVEFALIELVPGFLALAPVSHQLPSADEIHPSSRELPQGISKEWSVVDEWSEIANVTPS